MMKVTCCLLAAALLAAPSLALAEDPAPNYLRISPEALERIDSASTKRAWSAPLLLSGGVGMVGGVVLLARAADDGGDGATAGAIGALVASGVCLAIGLFLDSSASADMRAARGLEETDPPPAPEPPPSRRVFVR